MGSLERSKINMKIFAVLSSSALAVQFDVIKESGFTRAQAQADCESRGQTLANIYSQSEQDALNSAITLAGGLDRAFWLGMYEDGDTPNGDEAKDSDGNPLGFNGFRPDQPSNRLNHPNDKHTTGLNEDCVRQFGIEGWNDAICSRTWSGAKKHNVQMGHVCETRTSPHASQHVNNFRNAWHDWVAAFLPSQKIMTHWGERKIDRFAARIQTRIMRRKCASDASGFGGISGIDANGDGISQLATITQEMKDFFGGHLVANCKQCLIDNLDAKLDRWE